MSSRKGKKQQDGNKMVPPGASPPPEPKKPTQIKGKKTNSGGGLTQKQIKKIVEEEHKAEGTWQHFFSDIVANLASVFLSIVLIYLSPRPEEDFKKPKNASFFTLYMAGKLDEIDYIDQMLVAGFFSVFLDIGVVSYHIWYPPHPKFVLRPSRKISIYTHLIAGITEIVSGIVAFMTTDHEVYLVVARVMATASLTHVVTAYYQTGLVFGAKGIMVPGYLYAITLHGFSAIMLWQNVDSCVFLLHTYLMLHIYVWCRFFIYFFRVFTMFTGYHYTVSIMLSGLLLFPFSVGPIGNFGMLFVVILYCSLKAFLSHKSFDFSDKLFREHERYALVTSQHVRAWKEDIAGFEKLSDEKDKQVARTVFDKIDENKSGKIDVMEIHRVLGKLNLPDATVNTVLQNADTDGDHEISFDEFYRHIWNAGTCQERLALAAEQKGKGAPITPKEKAKIVFQLLDIDNSGSISIHELDLLLTQWGMPYNEANAYLVGYLKDEDKTLDFEQFYRLLRPIWEFAITQIYG